MRRSIIVAAASNGVIGKNGTLPWHLSKDLRRFKSLTMGHAIIMGRRTFASIGKPLPGRRTIVVTRRPISVSNVESAKSFADALAMATGDSEVFAVGGAGIYAEAFSIADRVYLTRIEATIEGDTFFPLDKLDGPEWELVEDSPQAASGAETFSYRFQVYHRRIAAVVTD